MAAHKSRTRIHCLQHFFDRRSRYIEVVRAFQLTLDPSRAQPSCTQFGDPLPLNIGNPSRWRSVGTARFPEQSLETVCLITLHPLAQSRSRDAAPEANLRAVLQLIKQLDPPEALPNLVTHWDRVTGNDVY